MFNVGKSDIGWARLILLMILILPCVAIFLFVVRSVRRSDSLSDSTPLVGRTIPSLDGVDINRHQSQFEFGKDNRPAVLYIFSPLCHWCEANEKAIAKLSNAKRNEFDFEGISLTSSGLKEYVRAGRIKFPVLVDLTPEDQMAIGSTGTPTTLVVSVNGKVMKQWTGAYVGLQKAEIESFFRIRLD